MYSSTLCTEYQPCPARCCTNTQAKRVLHALQPQRRDHHEAVHVGNCIVDAYKTDLKIPPNLCEVAKTALVKGIHLLEVESGHVVYHEGDAVNGVYICLTAQIELQHSGCDGPGRPNRNAHDVVRMFGRRMTSGHMLSGPNVTDEGGSASSGGDSRHATSVSHTHMTSHTQALLTVMKKGLSTAHPTLKNRSDFGAQHSQSDQSHRRDTQHLSAGDLFGLECLISERHAQDHTALVTRTGYVIKINAWDYRHARLLEAEAAIASRTHAIRSALQVGDRAPPELLAKLAVCMEEHSYEMGHFLARQGQRPEVLYIILSGACMSSIDVAVRQTTSPQQPLLPAIRSRYTDNFDEKPPMSESPHKHAIFSHKHIVLANTESSECVGLADALLRQDKCIATVLEIEIDK
jgi:CRP-like cAMP-binding protein